MLGLTMLSGDRYPDLPSLVLETACCNSISSDIGEKRIWGRKVVRKVSETTAEHAVRLMSDRPFVIDLDSTNGTHVNGQEIPKSRYYELRVNDGEFCLTLRLLR